MRSNPPKQRMIKAREKAARHVALGAMEHGYIDAGDLAGKERMGPKHRAELLYPHDAQKRTSYTDGWMLWTNERKQNPTGRHRKITQADLIRHLGLEPVPKKPGLWRPRKPSDAELKQVKIAARCKNPSFYIHIQKAGKGPVMLWNGKSFSGNYDSRPLPFSHVAGAMQKARWLLGKYHRQLSNYKIWVSERFFGAAEPKRRVNPDLDAAAQKLEDFTGTEATRVVRASPRSDEKTGLVFGELDLIGYRAARKGIEGGRMTRYAHKFRKGSRPLLAASTDGKQLHVVGGRYEFTEAGIEDR